MSTFRILAFRRRSDGTRRQDQQESARALEPSIEASPAAHEAIGRALQDLGALGREVANDGLMAQIEKLRGDIAGDMERLMRMSRNPQS